MLQNKSLRFRLGIIVFVISNIFLLISFSIPFWSVSFETKATFATICLILSETLFVASVYLLGKEIIQKYKKYLNPLEWFRKKESKYL